MNPLPPELSAQLAALSPVQLAWLSGWCWAKADGSHAATAADPVSTPAPAAAKITTMLAVTMPRGIRHPHPRPKPATHFPRLATMHPIRRTAED